ncbi:restriction endonuclease subunit S [Dyadobacter fermentans]|uniref:restriction endonuclease subunit S n=1 Tax=Dyadobacter fermentans TaxID=94254 RepID=UPI001CBB5B5E|nr:restriction endonuclease subunit S [Dyadobacter fermentans]MBZ1358480.1 restriction endonuclease subunit S [Dyadobacter fermentans]
MSEEEILINEKVTDQEIEVEDIAQDFPGSQYFANLPENWKIVKIKEIAKITSGTTPLRSNKSYHTNGTVPWVKTTDLNNSEIIDTEEKITELALKETSLRVYPVDTVLVAMYGGFNQIGRTGILGIEATINQALSAITVDKERINPSFLLNWLNAKVGWWKNFAGSSRKDPNITSKDVGNFPFLMIPVNEQRAIASLFDSFNSAINQNNRLIAQKELRKKWLMQNLLTGKKRLRGFEDTKWKIRPLEDFIRPVIRQVAKPETPYLGLGIRSHGKGTFLKRDEQPEKNSMDKFYVVHANDLIVNITFAWEQAIAIAQPKDDGALASHRFPTYRFIQDKGFPDFFRFYIIQPRMKYMLELISPGGAGRNRVMSKSDFIKLEFLLPDHKEQVAIAEVVSAADKEIQLLRAKTEKLREQKKGMMQVLLTGKKRLKLDDYENTRHTDKV